MKSFIPPIPLNTQQKFRLSNDEVWDQKAEMK